MKRLPQKNPIKLSINKDNLKKNESDTRPLSYACDAFTIASKNKSKCQINAPFLSHANRFNQNEKESHG